MTIISYCETTNHVTLPPQRSAKHHKGQEVGWILDACRTHFLAIWSLQRLNSLIKCEGYFVNPLCNLPPPAYNKFSNFSPWKGPMIVAIIWNKAKHWNIEANLPPQHSTMTILVIRKKYRGKAKQPPNQKLKYWRQGSESKELTISHILILRTKWCLCSTTIYSQHYIYM